MINVINILTPIFLIIALGWFLARAGFLSSHTLKELNRLTYWIGIPCLLFYKLANASLEFSSITGLLTVTAGATILAAFATIVAGILVRLPGPIRGTVVQGIFRGNLIFIGLPVILYTFSSSDTITSSAEASALLAFGPLVVLYNIAAVVILLISTEDRNSYETIRKVGYGLITNPILAACVGGLLFAVAALELPTAGERVLSSIGQLALPLALVCIGGTLHTTRLKGNLRLALASSFLKVALLPAIGLLLFQWVDLSTQHARIALILLACPTASATYVLVRELGGDEGLASSIIVISHVLALPAMIVVLQFSEKFL